MNSTLSSAQRSEIAQRAAITRNANRNGTGAAPASNDRPAGLEIELRISAEGTEAKPALRVTFGFAVNGVPAPADLISDADRALSGLQVRAYYEGGESGPRLMGYSQTVADVGLATVATLESILPLMRRVETFIGRAIQESEDDSFAQVISALAGHFRVSRITYQIGNETREAKRGAAYITAHRLAESFLAQCAKAES